MSVRWDVFRCTSCPPEVDKKWDIALLAEHHAIVHMDNFYLYECPVCHKKHATPLAAQFHIRKCVGNGLVDVSDYTRNILTVDPKLFVDLHCATLNAFRAYVQEQKTVSVDSQTQTDGAATAESEPDVLNTVIALLGGKAERVGSSESKEKMTEMWNKFTTAPAEEKGEAENDEIEATGEDEYEEIVHDDTIGSSVVDDVAPITPPEPSPVIPRTRTSRHPVILRDAETPNSSLPPRISPELKAPIGIPISQSTPLPTNIETDVGRARSVMPELTGHSYRQRVPEGFDSCLGASSAARESANAQKPFVAPPNLGDAVTHRAETHVPSRIPGGTEFPKSVPLVDSGSSSLQEPPVISKNRSVELPPIPTETSHSRQSIAEVEPSQSVEAIPLSNGVSWRMLPLERSKIVSWSAKISTLRFNRSDADKFQTAQRKRKNTGELAEFKIPFKKPLLNAEGVPRPPENGFRHPLPPGVVDPRRRALNSSESSVPPRAESRGSYISRAETCVSYIRESSVPPRVETRDSYRSHAPSQSRPSYLPESSHAGGSHSTHWNPIPPPTNSRELYPARAQSVMSHFPGQNHQQPQSYQRGLLPLPSEAPVAHGQAAGNSYFITPPNSSDAAPRRALTRPSRKTEGEVLFSQTDLTDVAVTITQPWNGTDMKLYFTSQYLTKFSSVFRQKLSQSHTVGMKTLSFNEHGLAFLYAMCAFHLKPLPVNPLCDRTGQFTIFRGDLLCLACEIVERYDLQGAMEQIAQLIFSSRCHRVALQNGCPSCIDRVAIGLRFKMNIPESLKFTKEAVARWLTFSGRKSLAASKLGNVPEVSAYLQSQIQSIVNK